VGQPILNGFSVGAEGPFAFLAIIFYRKILVSDSTDPKGNKLIPPPETLVKRISTSLKNLDDPV